jgi:hypothetical protein
MKKPFAVAVSVCLLMLQLSGAHVHADETGYIGVPEVSYKHSHGHHDGDAHHHDAGTGHSDGDHEDMRDVSLQDAALSTFKMPLALIAFLILIVVVPTFRRLISTDYIYPILSGRHTRWRPPLRAPPLHA